MGRNAVGRWGWEPPGRQMNRREAGTPFPRGACRQKELRAHGQLRNDVTSMCEGHEAKAAGMGPRGMTMPTTQRVLCDTKMCITEAQYA